MHTDTPTNPAQHTQTTPARAWTAGVLLALAVLVARVVYLTLLCPYDLIEDEAHYWLWAERLDWSYYSKGPGVALAIRASTGILGDAEWAIRLPAAISGFVTSCALALLAVRMSPTAAARSAGLIAAATVSLIPAYQFTSILMTIDGPYLACWALALLGAHGALLRGSLRGWLIAGVAIGVGFLFKYTILMLIPSLALAAWSTRDTLSPSARWRSGLAIGTLTLCALTTPVWIWNAGNDWVTVRHLLGHLGVAGGDMPTNPDEPGWAYNPGWTLEYIGVQFLVVGPALGLMIGAFVRRAHSGVSRPDRAFALWCALPLLVLYLGVTLLTRAEGNWAIAGYLSLVPLASAHLADRLGRVVKGRPDPSRFLWHATVIVGALTFVGLARLDLASAGVRALMGHQPGEGVTRSMGRLIGAKAMGAHANTLLAELKQETGTDAFLLVDHYGRASQLSYYTGARVVYTSRITGGRTTQFQYWDDTSPTNPELEGRSAVIVASEKDWLVQIWQDLFERVEPIGPLDGEHKRDRSAWIGHGYTPPHPPPHTHTHDPHDPPHNLHDSPHDPPENQR